MPRPANARAPIAQALSMPSIGLAASGLRASWSPSPAVSGSAEALELNRSAFAEELLSGTIKADCYGGWSQLAMMREAADKMDAILAR